MEKEINQNQEIQNEAVEKVRMKLLSFNNDKWYKYLSDDEKILLFNSTSFLPKDTSLSERRWYFVHNLNEIHYCPACGKRIPYRRYKLTMFCSNECRNSKIGVKLVDEITAKNYAEKYGISKTKEDLKDKLKKLSGRSELITEEELDILNEYTKFLPEDVSLKERVYYFMNDLTEIQKCVVCGKKVRFLYSKHRLSQFCSDDCRSSKDGKQFISKKTENTCLQKFGTKAPAQNPEVMKKMQDTCMKLYGVVNAFQSEEKKEKSKETCLKKYGKEYANQNEEIKEKIRETCLTVYGYEHATQSKEVQDKIKSTNLEKYGAEVVFASEEIKEKIKKTNIEKFGCDNPNKCKEIIQKGLVTKKKANYDVFLKIIEEKGFTFISTYEDYINSTKGSILKFKCNDCGEIFEYKIKKAIDTKTIKCKNPIHHPAGCSQYEYEIYDWLKSLGIENIEQHKRDWERNKRKLEADLFLPDYNLAIEFHGIYWHSNLYTEDNYHLQKFNFFKNMGIESIQIFENEWLEKKDIIKGIILNRLNKLDNLIITDNFIIKEVEKDEYENFLNQNSVYKFKNYDVALGIYDEDNMLIKCISFKNCREKWYIVENCTKCINIPNDLSKIIEYFRKTHTGSIIVWNDVRYFNNDEYVNCGFKYTKHEKPKCQYFKHNDMVMMDYEKLNIDKKLYGDLTKKDYLSLNDYLWIYDAGYDVLVLE